MKLSERIEAILGDIERATPGRWRWSENGNIVPEVYADDCEIAAVYGDDPTDQTPPYNAIAIMASVNFIREHGQALADLARRVEGAAVAIMDTRDVLGLCAPSEEDFPSLYALQGKRVALVPLEGE